MKKRLFIILVFFLILSTAVVTCILYIDDLYIDDYSSNAASDIPIDSPQEKYASVIDVYNTSPYYSLLELEQYDEFKGDYTTYTPKEKVKFKILGKTYIGVEPKIEEYGRYTIYQSADKEQFASLCVYHSGELRSISFKSSNEEMLNAAKNPLSDEYFLSKAKKLAKEFIVPSEYDVSFDANWGSYCEVKYSKRMGSYENDNYVLFRFQGDGKLLRIEKGQLAPYKTLNYDMDKALEVHYQKCDSTIELLSKNFRVFYNKPPSIFTTRDGIVCLSSDITIRTEDNSAYIDTMYVITRLSD